MEKKIAIVGAGVAGLTAAFELSRCGISTTVFEGQNRVGGRCRTVAFQDSAGRDTAALAELGAMRVPPSHETVGHYVAQCGLTRAPFPNPGFVDTLIGFSNQTLEWRHDGPLPQILKTHKADLKAAFYKVADPLIEAFAENNLEKARSVWQGFIWKYASLSNFSVLHQILGWHNRDLYRLGAIGGGTGGMGPMYGTSFLAALRFILYRYDDEQYFLTEGFEALPHRLAEKSPHLDLQLGAEVIDIETPSELAPQVCLQVRRGHTVERHTFDAVIVATTTRRMEHLGLAHGSGRPLAVRCEVARAGIRELHATSASKLFVRTPTKFWKESRTYPQCVITDEIPRAIYGLDYPGTDEGVVLLAYTWEDDAAFLAGLPREERLRIVAASLEAIYPRLAQEVRACDPDRDVIVVDWETDRWSLGGFQLPYPGQDSLLQGLNRQFMSVRSPEIDTGVYLAGEAVSWQGGWIEGAHQTGINAACAAAEKIGARVRKGSPLDIEHRFDYQWKDLDMSSSSNGVKEAKIYLERLLSDETLVADLKHRAKNKGSKTHEEVAVEAAAAAGHTISYDDLVAAFAELGPQPESNTDRTEGFPEGFPLPPY